MKAETADTTGLGASSMRSRPHRPWAPVVIVALVVLALAGMAGWMLIEGESGATIPGFTPVHQPRPIADIGNARSDISMVRIEGRGRTVTLERGGDSSGPDSSGAKWRFADSGGYPVPEQRVAGLLENIAGLKPAYVSEQSPPPYKAVGLDALDDPAGPTTRLSIVNGGGDTRATFTLGTSISAPGPKPQPMTSVLLPNDSRIWLVPGDFKVSTEPTAWMDSRLANVPPDELAALTITEPGGTRLALRRTEESSGLTVTEGLPPGAEVRAPWLMRDLASVLTDLQFLDVQRAGAGGSFDAGTDTPWKADIKTRNGITYHATLIPQEMGAWATFRAEAETESARGPAAQFNARHEGWAYLLNQYATRKLTTRPQDLMEAE